MRTKKVADKSSQTQQAIRTLRAEICANTYPEDVPFTSEHRLCERFKLSRMTIRNILQALQTEGLVYRIEKRGTFVTPARERTPLTVALLVDQADYLASPFLATVLQGINRVAGAMPLRVTIPQSPAGVPGNHCLADAKGGLLLPGTFSQEALNAFRTISCPIVRIAETDVDFPGISLGVADAARELAEHLLQGGRRRIAMLQGHGGFLDREKRRGIDSALRAHRVTAEPLWSLPTGYRPQKVPEILDAWFAASPKPDAIIAFDDTLALAAMQWARQKRIAVPRRLAIAGFNNTAFASLLQTPLTSVAFPIERAAEAATRLLVATILGKELPKSPTLRYTIHWRASTGEPGA